MVALKQGDQTIWYFIDPIIKGTVRWIARECLQCELAGRELGKRRVERAYGY
jgi:hypothetical protein